MHRRGLCHESYFLSGTLDQWPALMRYYMVPETGVGKPLFWCILESQGIPKVWNLVKNRTALCATVVINFWGFTVWQHDTRVNVFSNRSALNNTWYFKMWMCFVWRISWNPNQQRKPNRQNQRCIALTNKKMQNITLWCTLAQFCKGLQCFKSLE